MPKPPAGKKRLNPSPKHPSPTPRGWARSMAGRARQMVARGRSVIGLVSPPKPRAESRYPTSAPAATASNTEPARTRKNRLRSCRRLASRNQTHNTVTARLDAMSAPRERDSESATACAATATLRSGIARNSYRLATSSNTTRKFRPRIPSTRRTATDKTSAAVITSVIARKPPKAFPLENVPFASPHTIYHEKGDPPLRMAASACNVPSPAIPNIRTRMAVRERNPRTHTHPSNP